MERFITDKRTGITYEWIGDYCLPIAFPMGKAKDSGTKAASVSQKVPRKEHTASDSELADCSVIGRFGRAHEAYLKSTQRHVYSQLVAKGRLRTYLVQIDEQANNMLELLIRQMAEREGVTERLKAVDQMEWVRRMNNIRSRATEIVNNDLIYA